MKIDIEDLTTVLVSARNNGQIEGSAAKKIVRDAISKVYDRKAEVYIDKLRLKQREETDKATEKLSLF